MTQADLKATLKKHEAFWAREPGTGPLLNMASLEGRSLYAPLQGVSIPLADGTILSTQGEAITPDMINPRLILDAEEFPAREKSNGADGPLTVDDLLVTRAPFGKIPWVEAILGCPVVPRLDTGSIYSAPFLGGPELHDTIQSPDQSPWLDLLKEYTRALVEDSGGSYQVGQCLQRGPTDLTSAVLGHTKMCLALYDSPNELKALAERCTETFITVAKAQQSQVPELEGGFSNPFGVWSPGSVVRTQCDVASSISAAQYEEFFFLYDTEICKNFDYSVVHLHSGYLHHMDVFLKERYPTAVQVSLDTGSTPYTVHDLIPVFARVLESKPLFVQGDMKREELDELLSELPSSGLYVSPRQMFDD
ncbi:MAG: uroporphyrinogen decarboxylase family protein [Dehalococcoidia bacterium]|jgi:hypothetical protein|nr:uroporphyrinogen decarboxylase family protein [Dehalococcoidia bacterium]